MPKAQKKARSSNARATSLAPRNANSSKQAPASKNPSKSKKAEENEPGRASSSQAVNLTATINEAFAADAESANNYLILVTLTGSMNPTINRLLSLPPSLTFDKVHQVLQIAFGWANCHMHDFNVSLIDDLDDDANLMDPPVCLSLTPHPTDLPEDLEEDTKAEADFTLADVYENPEWKDKVDIEYEYDHGDGWVHHLALIGRATPGTNAQFGALSGVKVMCLSGQGHPVAEDAGGMMGWEDLKDAFKHPRKADSRERIDWYKSTCLNGNKSLDPYAFDVLDVNDGLRDAFFAG